MTTKIIECRIRADILNENYAIIGFKGNLENYKRLLCSSLMENRPIVTKNRILNSRNIIMFTIEDEKEVDVNEEMEKTKTVD